MAAPAKDGFSEILKVVCSMLSRNECAVFREPVDWKGLELLDYPEIVQRPMDLGTIKKKIENDDYACVEDIATDIRLVWSNCMLYNRDGSEVRYQDFNRLFAVYGQVIDTHSFQVKFHLVCYSLGSFLICKRLLEYSFTI